MKKTPAICPSCEATLKVSSLSCTKCDTLISGTYDLPIIASLPQEDQIFILDFILSGGSLKAMAKQMKKSYPTVRNRLDELIDLLKQLQENEH